MNRRQDVLSGLALVGLAAFIFHALSRIPRASYQAIPPDLFPRLCAIGLVLGGGALVLRGVLRGSSDFEAPYPRSILAILAAVVAFGVLAPVAGYAPAGLVTVFVSGLASPQRRPGQLAVFSVGIVALAVFLFSILLKLNAPALILPGFRF